MNNSIKHITEQLKVARRSKGLTQRDVSERVGLPQSHISRIERGDVDLQVSNLIEIARALDLELLLVSRSILPATKEFQRREEEQQTRVQPALPALSKTFQKYTSSISEWAKLFSKNTELEKLSRTVNEIRWLPVSKAKLDQLNEGFSKLQPSISALKSLDQRSKEYTESIQPFLLHVRQLQELMSALKDSHLRPFRENEAVPAYRLTESEREDEND